MYVINLTTNFLFFFFNRNEYTVYLDRSLQYRSSTVVVSSMHEPIK